MGKTCFYKITASDLDEFNKLSTLADSLPQAIRENIQHIYRQSGVLDYIELKTVYDKSAEIKLPSNFGSSRDDGECIYFSIGEKNSWGGFNTHYTLIYKRNDPSQLINLTII